MLDTPQLHEKPPIVAFASTKGGVGKTTLAYSLATEITRRLRGGSAGNTASRLSGMPEYLTSCIDADPNRTLTEAIRITRMPEIQMMAADGETLLDVLRKAQASSSVVLIDLEGTANQAMLYACGKADLVLIPAQPSRFDVLEAVKTAGVVRQAADLVGREIGYRVVLSRTPVLRQRVAEHSRSQFMKAGLPMLNIELVQRTAFQTMTYSGEPPFAQEPTGGAARNVEALTDEVVAILGMTLPAVTADQAA
jgi:chromosome partitioning protein